jgi:hypothetical protein
MLDDEETVQDSEGEGRHSEEVHARDELAVVATTACGRRWEETGAGDSARRCVQRHRSRVLEAHREFLEHPQQGFSFTIRRMRVRTSASTLGLPSLFGRERRRQNNRNPTRCQATTVSGLTITRT